MAKPSWEERCEISYRRRVLAIDHMKDRIKSLKTNHLPHCQTNEERETVSKRIAFLTNICTATQNNIKRSGHGNSAKTA